MELGDLVAGDGKTAPVDDRFVGGLVDIQPGAAFLEGNRTGPNRGIDGIGERQPRGRPRRIKRDRDGKHRGTGRPQPARAAPAAYRKEILLARDGLPHPFEPDAVARCWLLAAGLSRRRG